MDMAKMALKVGAIVFLLCLGCVSMQAKGQACNARHKETLIKVKQSLGNPPSLSTWKASTDCCSGGWHGITCSRGRVIEVTLSQLSDVKAGIIYPGIHGLNALEFLSFAQIPGLGGDIPPAVGNLIELKELVIDTTGVTGQIPASISKLENLHRLILVNNKLTGPIPNSLLPLQKLREIELLNNQLTGPLPPSLGQLPSLSSLRVSNNELNGTIPTILPKKLATLLLDHNRFVGNIPDSLAELSYLSGFSVAHNKLEGHIPSGLSAFGVAAFLGNTCLCGRPFKACDCCNCPRGSATDATMNRNLNHATSHSSI